MKKTIKKSAKKKVKKIKGRVRAAKKPKKNSDVIFDSSIGETDALFVSAPEPEKSPKPNILPLDPEIDQAIKELDFLENTPKPKKLSSQNPVLPLVKGNIIEAKKSFWQKLLFFKK